MSTAIAEGPGGYSTIVLGGEMLVSPGVEELGLIEPDPYPDLPDLPIFRHLPVVSIVVVRPGELVDMSPAHSSGPVVRVDVPAIEELQVREQPGDEADPQSPASLIADWVGRAVTGQLTGVYEAPLLRADEQRARNIAERLKQLNASVAVGVAALAVANVVAGWPYEDPAWILRFLGLAVPVAGLIAFNQKFASFIGDRLHRYRARHLASFAASLVADDIRGLYEQDPSE